MGTHSYSDVCPKCSGNNLMCCSETRNQFVSGECVDCGYTFYPREIMLNFKELNERREDYELKPLTKKEFNKIREVSKE